MQVKQILKDNVITLRTNNLKNVKTFNVTGNEVKRIAHYLCEKLDDYSSEAFYCKAAWSIPERQLMIFLENAQQPNVRDPRKVFTWQVKQVLSSN